MIDNRDSLRDWLRFELPISCTMLAEYVRRRKIGPAARFLLDDIIPRAVSIVIPEAVGRYWWLGLLGLMFFVCEVAIVFWLLAPRAPENLLRQTAWPERIALAQLATEALGFSLAVVGGLLAIASVRKALERPKLVLFFSKTRQVYHLDVSAPDRGTGWRHVVPLHIANESKTMAHNIKLKLWFENEAPFRVESISGPGLAEPAPEAGGLYWHLRADEGFVVHGGETETIAEILLSLPIEYARDVEAHLPPFTSHRITIRATVFDAAGRRTQTLLIVASAARTRTYPGYSISPVGDLLTESAWGGPGDEVRDEHQTQTDDDKIIIREEVDAAEGEGVERPEHRGNEDDEQGDCYEHNDHW